MENHVDRPKLGGFLACPNVPGLGPWSLVPSPPIRAPQDRSEQIDLEKPCRLPQRMPQNLDSGAKIGLATCLGTLVPIWPQKGGWDSNPRPLGTKSRVLDHSAPGGHSPGGSAPRGITPLGNHPLGNQPPGESSHWGFVPLGNHPPGEGVKASHFASAANIV